MPSLLSVLNENAGSEGVSLKCLVYIMADIEISLGEHFAYLTF